MSWEQFTATFVPAIEDELHQVVQRTGGPGLEEMRYMLAYHMGWEGPGAGPEARGKRLRPQFVLLTCAAAGGEWQRALPAAAAVELLHNFSLIHDDIEDNSPLRRGRETLWKRWGVPQAINAGDALFTLAYLALLDLERHVPAAVGMEAMRILQEACLHLTQGQYLDLSYESRRDLTEDAYWPMIAGKTAALLSACTGLGALVGGAGPEARAAYCEFGRSVGLAFQAQDDLLGIWGNAALTGKSADSDLLSGKKSLPVLYGLGQNGPFAQRWMSGPITAAEVPGLAAQLEQEGARAYTQERANELTNQALAALDQATPQGEAGAALRSLAVKLLSRQV